MLVEDLVDSLKVSLTEIRKLKFIISMIRNWQTFTDRLNSGYNLIQWFLFTACLQMEKLFVCMWFAFCVVPSCVGSEPFGWMDGWMVGQLVRVNPTRFQFVTICTQLKT